MAAGVVLTPGLAQAAGPAPAPAAPAGQGVAGTAAGTDAARKLPGKTFTSPADRTVLAPKSGERTALAAPAQGAQSAQGAQEAQAAPSAANSITIGLTATTVTAHAVDLQTIVIPSINSTLDVTISWGDGTTDTFSATLNGFASDLRNTKHTYAALGSYDVKVTAKDAANAVEAVNQVKVVTEGGEFTPHAPTRLLDTRAGIGAAQGQVAGRGTVALKVAGAAQVPAGASAVVLNVTVTNTTDAGHVSVQPEKQLAETAETSNLNYVAGQTVPNLVVAAVGADGYVYLNNAGWQPVDLIADVTGYFTPSPASGYQTLPQRRAVDTREGLGVPQGQLDGQASFDVQIAGTNRVPQGITAVALNLTATNPQQDGHLTAYPSGQAAPTTSNLNFTAGQTVANAVIVPVGPDGKITVRNGSWRPTDVIVDVVGYYTPDSRSALVTARVPFRIIDSRKDSWGRKAGPIPARGFLALSLEGDVTTPEVDGWVLNTTVTNTSGPGFLSVDPDPNLWSAYKNGTAGTPQRPVSSTLNWTAGATVPNVAQASGGKGGIVDLWNQGWQDIDLMVDLLGFYETK
ncbi:PKD domain-containing protein [Streptomyces novaecaesareae]|uniref:PKD domain-containing protein n=1 Tax=Streptomyces novaecaesareae TaxID=68244 RepID=UPI0004AAF0E5|nr:hypothetical protein [Streptomyces novaecaesareae]